MYESTRADKLAVVMTFGLAVTFIAAGLIVLVLMRLRRGNSRAA